MLVALCCTLAAGVTEARAQVALAPARSDTNNERLFYAAGQLYSLDPALLAAIAGVESGGNPDAVSPKGAQGLMQLMPATASRFRVLDPFDPVSNTLGAARFISYLRQYRTDHGAGPALSLPEMIAAYNAGEGAVRKYGGIPPYPETRHYVRKVLVAYLFGDTRSELATRLRAPQFDPAPPPRPLRARLQPVLMRERDPLEKLTEIQRLRELELSRQTTVSRINDKDGKN